MKVKAGKGIVMRGICHPVQVKNTTNTISSQLQIQKQMKTVEMQIPKKASAMQSICEWMEVWNTNFHYCSYAPDVWFWINMSLRAITRTHFERRHGKQSFMYLWLGYLKKLFVDAILDSYKYVCLRQKFVLFCLFLQPNCFCHWLAAKQDLILLVPEVSE